MHIADLLPVKEDLLICGTNWLGDSVMSMPALQALRKRDPSGRLIMLAKPPLVPLWRMHPAVDEAVPLPPGPMGTLRAAWQLRGGSFGRCFIFPGSFRSALIPFLARVDERVGAAGHRRAWMLSRVVDVTPGVGNRHQLWEYMAIVGLAGDASAPETPRLTVPAESAAAARACLSADQPWVGLVPGAARGPSKRWPAEYFGEAGRRLVEAAPVRIAIFGTSAEDGLCRAVAENIGARAVNLAGRTSLPQLAALLALCRVVIGNDSGAAHLATAVGSTVVAIFGMTDPAKTGPLGAGHRVITAEGPVRQARAIARRNEEAAAVLRSIRPDRVSSAALEILAAPGRQKS